MGWFDNWNLSGGDVGSIGPNRSSDLGAMSVADLMATAPGSTGHFNPTGMVNGTNFDRINGGGFGTDLGWNLGTGRLAFAGLSGLSNLWTGMEAMGLAKKQFAFNKDLTAKNFGNQIQAYNTALADRARARGAATGQSQAQIDDYIARNSLSR